MSQKAADREKLIEWLKHDLRKANIETIKTRRMPYRATPLASTSYHEIPLRQFMTPLVTDNGIDREALFDGWFAARSAGEKGRAELPHDLYEYVKRNNNDPIFLLFALGNSSPARLRVGRTYIMVECDDAEFGIKDGIVQSRFAQGEVVNKCYPFEVLNTPYGGTTNDCALIALWREAYRIDNGATEALIALKIGEPGFNFKRMLMRAITARHLTNEKFDEIEDIMFNSDDPISELYVTCVPELLSIKEFDLIFGAAWRKRKCGPNMLKRSKFYDALIWHFKGDD